MANISASQTIPMDPLVDPLDWTGDDFDIAGSIDRVNEADRDITQRFPYEVRHDIVVLADLALASAAYMESIKQFPSEGEIELIVRCLYQEEIFDKGEYHPEPEAVEIVVRWLVKTTTHKKLVEQMAKRDLRKSASPLPHVLGTQ